MKSGAVHLHAIPVRAPAEWHLDLPGQPGADGLRAASKWQSEVKAEWKAFKDQWNEIVSDITDAKEEDHAQWASVRMDTLILHSGPQLRRVLLRSERSSASSRVRTAKSTWSAVTVKKVKEKRGEEMVPRDIMEVTYVQPTVTVSVNGTTRPRMPTPGRVRVRFRPCGAAVRDGGPNHRSTAVGSRTRGQVHPREDPRSGMALGANLRAGRAHLTAQGHRPERPRMIAASIVGSSI